MTFILIYVTHENLEQAKKIANHLLDKKLIACANFSPITSMYFWNNKIEESNEIVSILKTKTENWEVVKKEIEKIHPYDTPCIIKLDVSANENYESWINKESSGS